MKLISTILLGSLALLSTSLAEQPANEQNEERMGWWREARFGMFIHWGLYSVAGGEWEGQRTNFVASWLANKYEIPTKEYRTLMTGFAGDRYDPEDWAALAKKAGMKYAVLTAKHHEGFCLFDSKLTDYTVMNTPLGRDVTREYLDAFRKAGLKAGLYYSVIDWDHPEYPSKGDMLHPMRHNDDYNATPRDLSKYNDYMHAQVRELLTGYGPLDVMWWDFSYGGMEGESWRAKELLAMCRELQPNMIMNNRLYLDAHLNNKGDFTTPENHLPPGGLPGLDWETCMTINGTWGYRLFDLDFKSSTELIRTLVNVVSQGGNYLLNIGPRADGSIPQPQVERLEAIGKWMDVNGSSIYGTTASPFDVELPWGRVTTKSTDDKTSRLYLHVFDWPISHEILLPPLANKIRGVTELDGGDELSFRTTEAGTMIRLPHQPRHEAATVLVMEIEGSPRPAGISPGASGSYQLTAASAALNGSALTYASGEDGGSIGSWTNPEEWVSWSLDVPKAGKYDVEVTYGCDPSGGGSYTVEIAGQKLTEKSRPTGGWFQRITESPGSVELKAGDSVQLSVRIHDMTGVAVMDLQKIELKPAPR
jgi:alpha-L-fucosidase